MPDVNCWDRKTFLKPLKLSLKFELTDQHQPQAGSVVPNFVLEAVVEDQPFAFLPRPSLVGDPYEGLVRDFQPQMASHAAVRWPAMAEDVRVGMENAELHLSALAGRRGGETFDHLASHGRELTILGFHAPRKQLQLLPVAGVLQILQLVGEDSFLRQQLQPLVPDDLPIFLNLHEIVLVRCLHFRPERRRLQPVHVVQRSLVRRQEETELRSFLVDLQRVKFQSNVPLPAVTSLTSLASSFRPIRCSASPKLK